MGDGLESSLVAARVAHPPAAGRGDGQTPESSAEASSPILPVRIISWRCLTRPTKKSRSS
jgi:hypothetical protein